MFFFIYIIIFHMKLKTGSYEVYLKLKKKKNLLLLFMLYFSDNCLTPPFFPFGTNHHHLSLFKICLYFWVCMHIWVLSLSVFIPGATKDHWTSGLRGRGVSEKGPDPQWPPPRPAAVPCGRCLGESPPSSLPRWALWAFCHPLPLI